MSDIQAETRDQVYEQHGRIAALEAQYEIIDKALKRIEEKIDNIAKDCPVGADHEKRIVVLEEKPEKKLSNASARTAIWTAIGAVLISIVAVVTDIFYKKP